MKISPIIAGLLTFCLLTGCSRDTPTAVMDNYLQRLSNALEIDRTAELQPLQRPLFPPRRQRLLPTQEVREGLLEVLKLRHCQLIPLIAERNSSLGKVYRPSLKMAYELKFITAISTCQTTLQQSSNPDPELLAKVTEIQQTKAQNLAAEIWNGIYTSEEVELNFSRSFQPLPLVDDQSPQATLGAMRQLVTLATSLTENASYSADTDHLEKLFQILYNNQSGPQIFSSLELLSASLNQAASLIETRLEKRPLCFMGKTTPDAKIVQNVFYKFYIGEVQPYMALSHRYAEGWFDLNNQLLEAFHALNLKIPLSMRTYQDLVLSKTNTGSLWQQYISARDRHTLAWQTLLKQCGMMPSTDTNRL